MASAPRPLPLPDRRFSVRRAVGTIATVVVFSASTFGGAWPTMAQPAEELTAPDAPSRGAANVTPEVAQKAASIARQTMSPFCPGRTLADCPSPNATEWRKDIRAMVAAGLSAAEIQTELERRAGGSLSGSPNKEASWAVPIFLALGAGLTLFFVFARLRPQKKVQDESSKKSASRPPTAATERPLVDDDRLERELENAD